MIKEDIGNIKISVRNLVEFILCSGDIDNRHGGKADKEAMQAGSRLHRKIQKRMGTAYHAEYPLSITVDAGQYTITVEGRADGIIIEETPEGDNVTIDEIKGMYMDLEYIKEPVYVHKAQAMCYGYIYGREHGLNQVTIQMTYANLDTEQIKQFKETISFETLSAWFENLMKEYKKWAGFQFAWRIIRNASIKPLAFPFAYRQGQKELAANVYRTISRRKRLFIQAPTGVGKTMSTIFPAVKAVGEGLGNILFYLTAKTITRTVAEEAFQTLRGNGLRYRVVTLTAKEKMCLCEEMLCNPDSCPYAKGHYDRVNEAVFTMINEEEVLSREVVAAYAKRFMVCPFEMSLDAALWCDAVICDYNYVFDPKVSLKRFFADGVKGDYLFLIDEAHNLVERGRDMFSAALYKEDFLELKKEVKYYSRKLEKQLERCNKALLAYKRECETYHTLQDIGDFVLKLTGLAGEMESFLEECDSADIKEKAVELYFSVRHFLNMYDRLDEQYVIYTEHESSGRFRIKLYCVNPSRNLRECLDKGVSSVFFSATLLPVLYYKALLGGEQEDYAVYVSSPFDEDNRLLLIGRDVSSKYTRRGQEEYQRTADYIKAAVQCRKGNYMVFFPSYMYMRDVYDRMDPGIPCICQQQGMDEAQREEFLLAFTEERPEGVVGFCVLGGIFGEGIDLTADRLIGVLVVGTGLPQISHEKEILKAYYDEAGENGFDYAYRFPGMNKVLQAAGRVIRTAEDRGIVLLLDERFHAPAYKNLFPREWTNYKPCTLNNAPGQIQSFWEGF